jgi:hypothetical protein
LVQKKSERDVVRSPSKSEDLSFERAAARLRKKPLVAEDPLFAARCKDPLNAVRAVPGKNMREAMGQRTSADARVAKITPGRNACFTGKDSKKQSTCRACPKMLLLGVPGYDLLAPAL